MIGTVRGKQVYPGAAGVPGNGPRGSVGAASSGYDVKPPSTIRSPSPPPASSPSPSSSDDDDDDDGGMETWPSSPSRRDRDRCFNAGDLPGVDGIDGGALRDRLVLPPAEGHGNGSGVTARTGIGSMPSIIKMASVSSAPWVWPVPPTTAALSILAPDVTNTEQDDETADTERDDAAAERDDADAERDGDERSRRVRTGNTGAPT